MAIKSIEQHSNLKLYKFIIRNLEVREYKKNILILDDKLKFIGLSKRPSLGTFIRSKARIFHGKTKHCLHLASVKTLFIR